MTSLGGIIPLMTSLRGISSPTQMRAVDNAWSSAIRRLTRGSTLKSELLYPISLTHHLANYAGKTYAIDCFHSLVTCCLTWNMIHKRQRRRGPDPKYLTCSGGVKQEWGGKNKLFSSFMRRYLENGTRYDQSYY